jgi:hypothetical protein
MAEAGPRAVVERLGRALVELARRSEVRAEDPKALLERVPHDQLVEMACQHRVPGVVFRALAELELELELEDEGFDGLRVAYQMAVVAHARCLVELRAMTETLAGLERPWLVVKGPVLAEIGYRDPGSRLYEDLDLLVSASDLPSSLELIEGAGGHVTDLNWPMMTRLRRAEIPMILPAGMLGDLHWSLLVVPNVRTRFRMPMEELVERRRVVLIGGIEVSTLDVVDGILYLCLHGSLSGGHQLVWLKDLDQMIESEPPAWDELILRARHYGLGVVAAMQLERARSVLGASVPDEAVAALAGGETWWRWWQWRERHVGVARWGGYDRTGRTFVSATSDGSLSSVTQLIRSLAADVVRPAVTARLKTAGPDDAGGTPPLHRPAGGVGDRAEYLRLVSSGNWG